MSNSTLRLGLVQWRAGRNSDKHLLKIASAYLELTGDWIAVRDAMIEMGMTDRAILDWFSEQDYPDFRIAVQEGWGWPEGHHAVAYSR